MSDRIRREVEAWPGVSVHPHRFGGIEFRYGTREIGHLHGGVLLDIPFPTAVRNELLRAGMARAHHVVPRSGWVSFRVQTPGDVASAIALLRRSYDLAVRQKKRRGDPG
jgi:hypothetical protein